MVLRHHKVKIAYHQECAWPSSDQTTATDLLREWWNYRVLTRWREGAGSPNHTTGSHKWFPRESRTKRHRMRHWLPIAMMDHSKYHKCKLSSQTKSQLRCRSPPKSYHLTATASRLKSQPAPCPKTMQAMLHHNLLKALVRPQNSILVFLTNPSRASTILWLRPRIWVSKRLSLWSTLSSLGANPRSYPLEVTVVFWLRAMSGRLTQLKFWANETTNHSRRSTFRSMVASRDPLITPSFSRQPRLNLHRISRFPQPPQTTLNQMLNCWVTSAALKNSSCQSWRTRTLSKNIGIDLQITNYSPTTRLNPRVHWQYLNSSHLYLFKQNDAIYFLFFK